MTNLTESMTDLAELTEPKPFVDAVEDKKEEKDSGSKKKQGKKKKEK